MTNEYILQAGAITYRLEGGVTSLLLVHGKKNPSHLIFPKGHVEPGETLEDAAIRELNEEAGVIGEVDRKAGFYTFSRDGLDYHVTYFLMKFIAKSHDGEPGRDPRWYAVDDALSLLSFPATRELLQSALAEIQL